LQQPENECNPAFLIHPTAEALHTASFAEKCGKLVHLASTGKPEQFYARDMPSAFSTCVM
jgi:hypothetical protein